MGLLDIDTTSWGVASDIIATLNKIKANFNSIKGIVGANGAVTVAQGGTGATDAATARANLGAAGISQTITDGVTDSAPSENAVADAIKLLATLNNPHFTGNVGIGTTSPQQPLHLSTNDGGAIRLERTHAIYSSCWDIVPAYYSSGDLTIKDVANMLTPLVLKGNSVGVGGVITPQATLHSTGTTIVGVGGTGAFPTANGESQILSDGSYLIFNITALNGVNKQLMISLGAETTRII